MSNRLSILHTIFLGNSTQAVEEIFSLAKKQGSCIVSFLYFANCMKARLFEKPSDDRQVRYKKALQWADILFADGIALQLFYRWSSIGRLHKKTPENLNWTDFIPLFLDTLCEKKWSKHISLYTMYDPRIGKSYEQVQEAVKKFEERFWFSLSYVQQDEYALRLEKWFDKRAYKKTVDASWYDYKVLIMCTWTPAQELWIENNRSFIEEQWVIVLNWWGFIDYISGFENRAPERVIRARVLETPRRILQNPKKNFHKFASMFGIVRYWISLLKK